MIQVRFLFFSVALMLGSNIFAADATPSTLEAGVYRSSSGYFSKLRVEDWSQGHLISGSAVYGELPIDFEIVVNSINELQKQGESSISVFYGPLQCNYPIRFLLDLTEGGFYLRSYMPTQFPSVSHGCPFVQSAWYISKKPYLKKAR